MIETMTGIRSRNPEDRFARNPGKLEVFSEERGAQLVDVNGQRFIAGAIEAGAIRNIKKPRIHG